MKLLVVDDSKAMRMIVVRTLKQAGFGDHPVSEAADGAEALALLQREAFDLVLSDWNMPEMSGLELLTAMKSARMTVRFGFVTSEGTEDMRKQARDAGASFLIAKPFTKESFAETLRDIIVSA
jgi:two-component system, chemotaxis family, chemotaxis protein CheY